MRLPVGLVCSVFRQSMILIIFSDSIYFLMHFVMFLYDVFQIFSWFFLASEHWLPTLLLLGHSVLRNAMGVRGVWFRVFLHYEGVRCTVRPY